MIPILIIIAMVLLGVALNKTRKGNYIGCLLYIASVILFVITGIYYVRHDEILIGILQLVAAVSALICAIYAKSFIDDINDGYYD
ncbi:MAG: hypothetical protein LBB85_02745 [Dysgonamonadaceae bacterium]|jgi:hypothetical protein|nr:hypothetical protein [Dysgonamonadaceae bacterium]